MKNIDQNEIDLSTLSIKEIAALRSEASETGNKYLLDKIHLFLNSRHGRLAEFVGSTLAKRQQFKEGLVTGKNSVAEHMKFIDEAHAVMNCPIRNNFNQKYGSIGGGLVETISPRSKLGYHHNPGAMCRPTVDFDIQNLVKGDEKILVLVDYGTPLEFNSHSIQFWDLQAAVVNVAEQYEMDTADLKDPQWTLMDPTFEERFKPDGLIQQAEKDSDIVLTHVGHNTWLVKKHPTITDNSFRHILKFKEVTVNDIFNTNPKSICCYIDHRIGQTSYCENLYAAFIRNLDEQQIDHSIISLMSGHPDSRQLFEMNHDSKFVIAVNPNGLLIKQAKGTHFAYHQMSINEATGNKMVSMNLSDAVTDPKVIEATEELAFEGRRKMFLKDIQDVDVTKAYPSAPSEIADSILKALGDRKAETQMELTALSIKRFGFILSDPETGLTVTEEQMNDFAKPVPKK